jgi:ATP-dependent Clp protease ATP-binding subunit ClpB
VALTSVLRPELVNRIDEIVVFNRLGQADLRQIIDRFVSGIQKLGAKRELELQFDDDVYEHLIRLGSSDLFGARKLRWVVDQHLRQPLAEEFLRRGPNVGPLQFRLREGALRLE